MTHDMLQGGNDTSTLSCVGGLPICGQLETTVPPRKQIRDFAYTNLYGTALRAVPAQLDHALHQYTAEGMLLDSQQLCILQSAHKRS